MNYSPYSSYRTSPRPFHPLVSIVSCMRRSILLFHLAQVVSTFFGLIHLSSLGTTYSSTCRVPTLSQSAQLQMVLKRFFSQTQFDYWKTSTRLPSTSPEQE